MTSRLWQFAIIAACITLTLTEQGSERSPAADDKETSADRIRWKPVFIGTPLPQYYVSRSHPVTLLCSAKNVCAVQIKCDGEKFQDGGGRKICGKKCKGCKNRKREFNIKLDDFSKEEKSKVCKCRVWGRGAMTSLASVIEKAKLRQKFGAVGVDYAIPADSTIVLPCKPPWGRPEPTITWSKNGRPILPRDLDKRLRLINVTNDLVIQYAAENDSGEYQCIAENIAARREGPVLRLCVGGNASVMACQRTRISCTNCSSCISRKWTCDGISNCSSGSDVTDCNSSSLLMVGTRDGIFAVDLHNTSRIRKIKAKNPIAIDFGVDSETVYWSDTKRVYRFSLQNDVNEDEPFRHDDVTSIEGIAVDWVGKKLYWTDSMENTIHIGDLRTSREVTLINQNLDRPRAIHVNPSLGFMYWTDWGRHPKIERARLDGTERKVLINSSVQFPNGLAFDDTEKLLYWTDGKYGRIEAMTSDGLNRTVILNGFGRYQPFDLDTYKDFIYWTDWKVNAVFRVHKSGVGGVKVILAGLNQPMGIKILHQHIASEADDLCESDNGGCGYLCLYLPHVGARRCFCKNGYTLHEDGNTCEETKGPGEREVSLESRTEPSLVVTLLIIILLLAVFWFLTYAITKRFSRSSSYPLPTSPDENQDAHDLSLATNQTEFTLAGSPVNESPNGGGERSVETSNQERVEASARNGIVVYMTKVEVNQNGGVTLVGDDANVHHHYSPGS